MLEWIVSSCFLILVILALRAALGRKISARFRYALWLLVLLRLLMPVQLFTLPVAGTDIFVNSDMALLEKSIYVLPVQTMPDAENIWLEEDGSISDADSFGYAKLEDEGKTVVRYAEKLSPLQILQIIWFLVGVSFLFIILLSNLHFAARLRRVRKPLEVIACRIPVYVAEGLPSPCLFGVLHPAVYVTERTAETPEMLRHVLAHELTHYRRLDHIWSLLRGIALAVHWWNPLVWLAAICSRRDGELACDEDALKGLSQEERRAYGETLLALVTAKPSPRDLFCCATTMSGEKRSLRERISWISCKPKRLVSAFVTVSIVAVLTSACAFGQLEQTEPPVESPPQTAKVYADMTDFGSPPLLTGDRKEGVYTFLLTGVDSISGNTDTIMVAAYDPAGQTLSVMSLPRHTAVMDGQRVSRLNDGCRQNIAVLQERVAALTGFTPDYYVQVNLDIVSQLVDLLGGVMFHVPVDMDYDDPYQNLHIHLRKGVQILDGEQAMGLVRYRWYREDNITREAVQQDFMKALLKECLDLKNWDKVMEYINLAYENAETDLEVPSIAWFAANILGLNGGTPLSVESVYTCTMPVEDEMKRVNGMAVVISRPSQTAELVNERFNPYQQEIIVSMLDEIVIEQS